MSQLRKDDEVIEFYQYNPVIFIQEQVFRTEDTGVDLEDEQKEMLEAARDIRDGKLSNSAGERIFGISEHSGHGVGKTTGFALLIIWWLWVHPTAKIPVTAVKKEQLADNLWPELKKWIDQSIFNGPGRIQF